jgi:hypothetical protein
MAHMIHYWYARVVGKALANTWKIVYNIDSE